MKRVWEAPTVEVLDISMTMMGPGKAIVDATYTDDDETVVLHKS